MENLSPTAQTALDKIRAIRKHPIPITTELAVLQILKNLGLSDYISVCAVLENSGVSQ
jgi:hypothetical protein